MQFHRHCERSEAIQKSKRWIASSLMLLAMTPFLIACSGYKTPGVSGNPSKMSADTLCYRYAYAKSNPALKDEVAARGLDCREVLDSQPAMGQPAVSESRW